MIFLLDHPGVGWVLGDHMVPLMIGARDMAFPRINALSFWLIARRDRDVLGLFGAGDNACRPALPGRPW